MSDAALEPGLTKYDKQVLAAVPSGAEIADCVSFWRIAEALDPPLADVQGLYQTLLGLEHLGYVTRMGRGVPRRQMVYWRTGKGDTALTS